MRTQGVEPRQLQKHLTHSLAFIAAVPVHNVRFAIVYLNQSSAQQLRSAQSSVSSTRPGRVSLDWTFLRARVIDGQTTTAMESVSTNTRDRPIKSVRLQFSQ
jgi:hypothetical protein